MDTLRYWLKGIRLYIAIGTLLLTGLVIAWSHVAYAGTTLYPTRIEEVFAWLAVGLLGLALSIGPAYKLFPRLLGKGPIFDARRMIGISAAWFATIHASIAYFDLFHAANPLSFPSQYQRSFLFGGIALLILLAMAFTSFDKAFRAMGVWWFRLHRFLYLAVGLILLHAFMSGVHATQVVPLLTLSAISIILLGSYGYLAFVRSKSPSRWQVLTLISMTIFIAAVLTYGFAQHGGGAHS